MAGSKGQSVPRGAQSSRHVGLGAQQTPPWHLQEGGHSALLPLSVLDVNDESPTFFPAIYNVSLPENVARDFRVVRLNCTDADVGLNAELSYFITGTKGCMGELWLWKRATCPRKSMRMGLMLLGRVFRAGILSGVLEHLMQVVFGGQEWADSAQPAPQLQHLQREAGEPPATLCLAKCTCGIQPSGNRARIQVSPE